MRVALRSSVLAAGLLALVGCGNDGDELLVFAASSLTDVMVAVEAEYERANPDVDVVVNLGGSSSLVAQLEAGAPAHVLMTADGPTMARARDVGAIVEPSSVLARNAMVIAVEQGNPLDVAGLDDLARDGLVVVLAAPEVPAGSYAAEALDCAGVEVEPSSLEQNVRAAAAKVAAGEADAAITYRTDIGDSLTEVEIAEPCGVDAVYEVAPVGEPEPDAVEFVDFVLGPSGQTAFADEGFDAP